MKQWRRYWSILLLGVLLPALVTTPRAPSRVAAQSVSASTSVGNKANFESDVIYQVLTDRFYDGDPSNNNPYNIANTYDPTGTDINKYMGGDWQGLIDKMSYLKNMGITAIWISPPYDNLDQPYLENGTYYTAYHGFWAKDYFRPDEHWGTWSKFDELVAAAHQHGIKVIVDFAPNHTNHRNSTENGGFYRDGVLMGRANNDTQGLFHHNGNRQDWQTTRFDYQYRDLANLSDLSQENGTVISYLDDAVKRWLDHGIDGIRNDATLHQNDAFLKHFADTVNAYRPVFHFGEFWISTPDPKYDDYRTQQVRTGVAILDFEYANTVRAVFGDFSKNMYDLWSMLQYTANDYTYINDSVTFIDSHDKARLATIQPNRGIAHAALAFHLTARGTPVIYYGTEQYLEGVNGDDGRRPMPGYDNKRTGKNLGWDETTTAYRLIKKLSDLRKSNPALQYGTTAQRWVNNDVLIMERQFYDDVVVVAINRSGNTYNITGLYTNLPQGTYTDWLGGLLGGNSITVGSGGAVSAFELGPTEVGVWQFRSETSDSPQIGAVGPTMGRPGHTVTIDGEGFGSTQGQVRFGTTPATLLSWENTQIKVRVPNMSPGVVNVTVVANGKTSNPFRYEVLSGPQVQVIFHVNATTNWGENIYVVGSIHELGNWDPAKAYMAFHNPNYPEWFLPVSVPANTTFEFKFIKKDQSGNVIWEAGPNRVFTSPASGTADTPLYHWQ